MKEELSARLKGVELKDRPAAAAAFAAERGYDLAEADFVPAKDEIETDELDSVVGGSGCGCFLGGYGKGGKLICSCIIAGEGTYDGGVTSQGGCECVAAGAGASNKHKKS